MSPTPFTGALQYAAATPPTGSPRLRRLRVVAGLLGVGLAALCGIASPVLLAASCYSHDALAAAAEVSLAVAATALLIGCVAALGTKPDHWWRACIFTLVGMGMSFAALLVTLIGFFNGWIWEGVRIGGGGMIEDPLAETIVAGVISILSSAVFWSCWLLLLLLSMTATKVQFSVDPGAAANAPPKLILLIAVACWAGAIVYAIHGMWS